MKKNFTSAHLNFPRIDQQPGKRSCVESVEEETDAQQVSLLDQWTCQSYQQTHKRSKIIKALFRDSMGRRMKPNQLTDSSLVIEAKLFLLRLETQLRKAHDINYEAIYKNIEFCSGIYENLYGSLLRQMEKLRSGLAGRYASLEESLRSERVRHIKSMEKVIGKENYKHQIPTVRKIIEDKEAELEPIKFLLEEFEEARVVILKKCLQHGYDVREEGLLWILNELEGNFTRQDFPKFLNEKQVEFLMNKYKMEQQAKQGNSMLLSSLGKNENEICEIVARKKKREFTMTRELKAGEGQNKLPAKLNSERHQLISNEVLRLAKKELFNTKATSYELIYKQTLRKLNKFCCDEIHNKRSSKVAETSRPSISTMNILSCFQAKVESYLQTCREPSPPKTQELALQDILRNLRFEVYHAGEKTRNAVSVIACLVGWKKAKRVIENEMNSVM